MKTPKKLPTHVSTEELRWLLGGVSGARLTQLEQEGVIQRTARGRYAMASVPAFIKAQRERGAAPKGWNAARTELARERAMAAKRADYFACGTLVVWDVDLLSEDVVKVYRASDPDHPTIYRRGETAEAEPAVPGWQMPVNDLFV